MQYMIAVYETDAELARRESEEAPAYWGAWTQYASALRDAGIIVGGEGLQPPHAATTVRVRDGRRMVQDGPYADTKERLGGFFIIEVQDLDTALDWAERCPGATTGAIEVRPTLGKMPR